MKPIVSLGIVALVGLMTGFALFSLTTGPVTLETISLPPCPQVSQDPAAYDPLTGLPNGYTFVCNGATVHSTVDGPQAIPVPVGFLLGAVAAGTVLLVDDRRRRRRDRA